jgi:hypothetical protein
MTDPGEAQPRISDEAAVEAMRAFIVREVGYDAGPGMTLQAQAVVETVRPFLEADIRARIADEIEAEITAFLPDGADHCEVAANEAIRLAASIARGSAVREGANR